MLHLPFEHTNDMIVTNGLLEPEEQNKEVLIRYDQLVRTVLPKGADSYENEKGEIIKTDSPDLPRSMFSDYHTFRIVQLDGANYPLRDEDVQQNEHLYKNITLKDLITQQKGAIIYKKEDLIYSKYYGKIPNNKLITLRRFAFPVFDDISGEHQTEPDVARVVGFIDGERNTIQKIMGFTAGLIWKDLTSDIQANEMQGSQDGFTQGSGFGKKGVGSNSIMNILKYTDPKFGKEAMLGDNALKYNPYRDTNKTHGPVDAITKVMIRDNGIKFEQDIELVFEFEAYSIDGVNPKAATIDWLSNILVIGAVDAIFWGGARYWIGARPTKFMNDLKFLSARDFNSFLTQSHIAFKDVLNRNEKTLNISGGGSVEGIIKTVKNIAMNALNLKFGEFLNKVGRPSIPYSNSLLNGTPLGTWHVMVGNPFNPAMSVGNLVCEQVTIAPSEDAEWSYDDFPNKWEAVFKLIHQQPRDRAGIERIFNGGKMRTYFKPEDVLQKVAPKNNKNTPLDVFDLAVKQGGKLFGEFDKKSVERNLNDLFKFFD